MMALKALKMIAVLRWPPSVSFSKIILEDLVQRSVSGLEEKSKTLSSLSSKRACSEPFTKRASPSSERASTLLSNGNNFVLFCISCEILLVLC